MGDLPQKFHAVSLFLQRERGGICHAKHSQRRSMQFYALPFAGRFLQSPLDGKAGSCRDILDAIGISGDAVFNNHLQILQAAAVVEFNEGETILGISPSPSSEGALQACMKFCVGRD